MTPCGLSIFSSMPCTWIWKQKVTLIWATDFSPPLFCFSIRTLQNFARLFLLFMLRKKGQQHNFSFYKQSTQSTNEKCDEDFTSAQDHVGYGRNSSCSCNKPLTESNRHLNCLWGLIILEWSWSLHKTLVFKWNTCINRKIEQIP